MHLAIINDGPTHQCFNSVSSTAAELRDEIFGVTCGILPSVGAR